MSKGRRKDNSKLREMMEEYGVKTMQEMYGIEVDDSCRSFENGRKYLFKVFMPW